MGDEGDHISFVSSIMQVLVSQRQKVLFVRNYSKGEKYDTITIELILFKAE